MNATILALMMFMGGCGYMKATTELGGHPVTVTKMWIWEKREVRVVVELPDGTRVEYRMLETSK